MDFEGVKREFEHIRRLCVMLEIELWVSDWPPPDGLAQWRVRKDFRMRFCEAAKVLGLDASGLFQRVSGDRFRVRDLADFFEFAGDKVIREHLLLARSRHGLDSKVLPDEIQRWGLPIPIRGNGQTVDALFSMRCGLDGTLRKLELTGDMRKKAAAKKPTTEQRKAYDLWLKTRDKQRNIAGIMGWVGKSKNGGERPQQDRVSDAIRICKAYDGVVDRHRRTRRR